MISFRQHLVSLVAVFLALAVGVVLGGGPLSEIGRAQNAAASTDAETGLEADLGDAYAAASAPAVLDSRLRGRGVTVMTLPGADQRTVEALGKRIVEAGGRVASSYAWGEPLLQPGEKTLVDTLGAQLMTQYGAAEVAADAPTYERLGQLLALATASTDPAGVDAVERDTSIVDSLVGGGLLTPTSPAGEGAVRKPPLVLVVLGDEPAATEDGSTPVDSVLTGLLAGLREQAAGVTVVGSTESGAEGVLSRLRAEEQLAEVTTVDGGETVVGQVTTVLALARSLGGAAGAFGASGADGAVPLG